MICTIRRVWSGPRVTTVIAQEVGTVRDTRCYVYTTTEGGEAIAQRCEHAERNGGGAKPQIVLTLKPATAWGYEIEEAELMPQTVTP